MNELKWTGERLVTELDSAYGTFEHLHRYALALELCNQKVVLDIASGEGYGTNLIAGTAKQVYGVDIFEEAVIHARKKYNRPNLKFMVGSATAIPLGDSVVDLVVSFETLEHLVEHDIFLSEIRRVLKPNGVLIMSTPDKKVYFERDPVNPYHLKELFTKEFEDLIKNYFNNVKLYTQKLFVGSVISEQESGEGRFDMYDGCFNKIQKGLQEQVFFNKPFFNIIVATDAELNRSDIPGMSIFSAEKAYQIEQNRLLEQASEARQELNSLLNTRTYKSYNRIVKILMSWPIRTILAVKRKGT
jgi:ubiquinone/menaquinone biosynthesis C-methylase UbiE